MSEEEEKEKKESENLPIQIGMDLKKLGQIYSVPFDEILKTAKEDRANALENYELLKGRLVGGDDTASAKEQLNKAMELIISSTDKLTSLVNSASKLWGDTVKAMAASNKERDKSPQEIASENEKRRKKLLEEGNEEKKN